MLFLYSNLKSWTETDANVTCQSLGFHNGTFFSYHSGSNLTAHLKVFMPKCIGSESHLLDCPGTDNPEQGLTVCERHTLVSLNCEGFHNKHIASFDHWAGIVFQRHAPYTRIQQFNSLFTNRSQSVLESADIEYAGLAPNRRLNEHGWYARPGYLYQPGSAVTVFQFGPEFKDLRVRYSLGNGLNFSNVEAPVSVEGCTFEANKGHGISATTRFGNVLVLNTTSKNNGGDGLKYVFNNTEWSIHEQTENFLVKYIEFCDSQNPLSYPAYYKFRNPNYVKECSKTLSSERQDLRITLHFSKVNIRSQFSRYWLEVYDGQTDQNNLIANYTFENGRTPESIYSRSNYMFVKIRFECEYEAGVRHLEPIEVARLEREQRWKDYKEQQFLYEKYLYKYNQVDSRFDSRIEAQWPWHERTHEYVAPLSLEKLTFEDRQQVLEKFGENRRQKEMEFSIELERQRQQLARARVYCPFASFDEITMWAMVGKEKDADLLVKDSSFEGRFYSYYKISFINVDLTCLFLNHFNFIIKLISPKNQPTLRTV